MTGRSGPGWSRIYAERNDPRPRGRHAAFTLGCEVLDDAEVGALLKSLEVAEKRDRPETFDLAAAIEAATATSRSKPGDLWQLGDHRLLHGDATSADDIARVLAGAKAAMAFTDPPYNVAYGDHGGQPAGAPKRKIANDAMSPEAWRTFVEAWAATILDATDGAIYLCMSGKEWSTVSAILAEAGGHWSTTIIWRKDRFVLGRAASPSRRRATARSPCPERPVAATFGHVPSCSSHRNTVSYRMSWMDWTGGPVRG